MKVQAIIPCAGIGARLKTQQAKSLIDLGGQPLFIHTIKAFVTAESVDSIILVVHKDQKQSMEDALSEYGFGQDIKVVLGGATRRASVHNGLKACDDDTSVIVVHDGARPLIASGLIDEAVKMCATKKAVIVAVPVKSTIKSVSEGQVTATPKRCDLWEVQTPQVFDKDLLLTAHNLDINQEATDDAMLVEQSGQSVYVMAGSDRNIKVTTQEDLIVAEAFLKSE